jgi:large conductance mechanosensitive channel
LNYGGFVTSCISLLLVAVAMFAIIRLINRVDEELNERFAGLRDPGDPPNKKCPFCLSTIAYRAVRCPNCTSQLEVPAATPKP